MIDAARFALNPEIVDTALVHRLVYTSHDTTSQSLSLACVYQHVTIQSSIYTNALQSSTHLRTNCGDAFVVKLRRWTGMWWKLG